MAGGININWYPGRKKRERKQRAREMFSQYLRNNPDLTLAESQEVMRAIEKRGRIPGELSTGRDIGSLTLSRPEPPDAPEPTGRVFTLDEGTGKLTMKQPSERGFIDVPVTPEIYGGGFTRHDKIIKRPRQKDVGGAGDRGVTPEQEKIYRQAINEYLKETKNYPDAASMPRQIVKNAADAMKAMGMPTEEVEFVTKRPGMLSRLFGALPGVDAPQPETETLDVPFFGGARRGQAGGGPAPEGRGEGGRKPETPEYKTPEDIRAAYAAGKITREKALRLLIGGD